MKPQFILYVGRKPKHWNLLHNVKEFCQAFVFSKPVDCRVRLNNIIKDDWFNFLKELVNDGEVANEKVMMCSRS